MPSPVDIDDIHDYYEAQSLQAFFDQAIREDKARKAAEQRRRENHPRTKLAALLRRLASRIDL